MQSFNPIESIVQGSVPEGWEIVTPGSIDDVLHQGDVRMEYGVPGRPPFLTMIRRASAREQHLIVKYHFTFMGTAHRVSSYVKHIGRKGLTLMKGDT